MRKVLYTVVIILLAGVFLFSGWQLLGIWREYRAGENCYEALDQSCAHCDQRVFRGI